MKLASKYVHRKCLNKWRKLIEEKHLKCMECREEYIVRRDLKGTRKLFKGNLFIYNFFINIISIIWSIFGNSRILYFLNQGYKEPTTENVIMNENSIIKHIINTDQIYTNQDFILVFFIYFLLTINNFYLFYYRICKN